MLRLKPKAPKARVGPHRRCAYLGTDERAGRDYFLSGPHVFYVRCGTSPASPTFGAGGRRAASPCAPLAAYNRQKKSLRRPAEG
jgi:hypothetical protein